MEVSVSANVLFTFLIFIQMSAIAISKENSLGRGTYTHTTKGASESTYPWSPERQCFGWRKFYRYIHKWHEAQSTPREFDLHMVVQCLQTDGT